MAASNFPGRQVFLLSATAVLFFLHAVAGGRAGFLCGHQWQRPVVGQAAAPKADGTDGPFASLPRAQQAVRQVKQAQADRDHAIVVAIRGGTYWLESPISFGAEDSGTERAPVVYQAFGDERPMFSGGRPITGWKTDEPGRWYVDLPDVKAGQWYFCQLFVSDQRRFRPQLPKQGYYKIAKAGDSTPEAGGKGFNRFGFSAGELDPNWANLGDVEVMPFHRGRPRGCGSHRSTRRPRRSPSPATRPAPASGRASTRGIATWWSMSARR